MDPLLVTSWFCAKGGQLDLEINLVADLMTNTSLSFINNLVEDLVGNNFGDLFVTNRKVPEPHDFPLLYHYCDCALRKTGNVSIINS